MSKVFAGKFIQTSLMSLALVLAAFVGASAGLIWQKSGWFDEKPEHEIVTAETPGG